MCDNGSTPPKTHAVAAIGVFGTGTRAENPIATNQMPDVTPWLVLAQVDPCSFYLSFRIPSENTDSRDLRPDFRYAGKLAYSLTLRTVCASNTFAVSGDGFWAERERIFKSFHFLSWLVFCSMSAPSPRPVRLHFLPLRHDARYAAFQTGRSKSPRCPPERLKKTKDSRRKRRLQVTAESSGLR